MPDSATVAPRLTELAVTPVSVEPPLQLPLSPGTPTPALVPVAPPAEPPEAEPPDEPDVPADDPRDRSDERGGSSAEAAMRSDDRGFIVRHDGSFSDFFQLVGAAHSIAPETSGTTPMAQAMQVNRIWLTGIIDLVAAEHSRR